MGFEFERDIEGWWVYDGCSLTTADMVAYTTEQLEEYGLRIELEVLRMRVVV